MIVSDSYFTIGDLHIRSGKPCQDYSIARVFANRAVAIVCDGCSSGGLTDVGARILAHSILGNQALTYTLPDHLIRFGLTWGDMLATCIWADNKGIMFYGDGCAVVSYEDRFEYMRINYESNAPYYFIYGLNGGYEDYLALQDGKRITLTISNGTDISVKEITAEEASKGIYVELERTPVSVTIFSDGICSFSGVDWIEACKELTNFKNMSGEYLKRRMGRAIQDYSKQGIKMMDDIAGASLYNME